MIIKSLHTSVKLLAVSFIMLMIAIITIACLIVISPRSSIVLKDYVEEEINQLSQPYKVKIDSSILKWDGFQKAFSIYVNNIELNDETGKKIADFQTASFDFSLFKLIQGRLLSPDLTLINPTFHIHTQKNITDTKTETDFDKDQKVLKLLYASLQKSGGNFSLHSINLKNAVIYIDNGHSDLVWQIDNGYAKLNKQKNSQKIISELNINFGANISSIISEISISKDDPMDFKVDFKNLKSSIFNDLFPENKIFTKLDFDGNGNVNFLLSPEGDISQMQFALTKTNLNFNDTTFFEKTLHARNLDAEGSFYEDFSTLSINRANAVINGYSAVFSGILKNHGTFDNFMPELNLTASTHDFTVNDLRYFWPELANDLARDWVTNNITGGKVTYADVKLKLSKEDFIELRERKEKLKNGEYNDTTNLPPPFPSGALESTIKVEGAKVDYFPGYEPVENVSGTVHFSGHAMNVDLHSGNIKSLNLSNGKLSFNNLWEHPLKLELSTDFDGNVDDLIHFLEVNDKYIEAKDKSELQSLYKATGHAKGRASLSLPIEEHLTYKDVNLIINSDLDNTTIPGFINGNDIKNAALNIMLDKNNVMVKGTGDVLNTKFQIDLDKPLSENPDYNIKYKINADTNIDDIIALGITKNKDFAKGSIKAEITKTIMSNNDINIDGDLDIGATNVTLTDIGFIKNSGINGRVKFNLKQANNENNFSVIDVNGDNFSANGTVLLNNDFSSIKSADFKTVKFKNNDFNINYKTKESGFDLNIKGNKIDLSPLKFNELSKNDDEKNTKKTIDVLFDVKNVYMKNNEIFREVTANVNCTKELCTSINLYGKIGVDNFIVLSSKPLGDRSSLMIESDNAGAVIKAFGISEHINEGRLNIESVFAKGVNKKMVASGVIKISNFKAIKTPLLGKILTIPSFQGIADLLNNEGITFKKFEAPFTMASGIITVKDARTSGSSVGITANGTINTTNGHIDLKGVIIPAHALNSAIGQIPVVGQIMTGKDSEGIFASRYSIEGDYEDAKTSVNPLSIITPGILRDVFGIFD